MKAMRYSVSKLRPRWPVPTDILLWWSGMESYPKMLNLKDLQDLLFKKSSEIKRKFGQGVRRSEFDIFV